LEFIVFSRGKKLLSMGSSKYREKQLPFEVRDKLDKAMENEMAIIVAEAHGSCRLYQDYLAEKKYGNVTVGHARSIRYNAGGWPTMKYGDNLKEREKNMMKDCDSAVVIWQDNSGVIAENLDYLSKLGKPTFLYEYSSQDGVVYTGMLDPKRIHRTFIPFRKP
jgi:hypothetical protein